MNMKKLILILLIIVVQGFVFGQNDTLTDSKNQITINPSIDNKIHNKLGIAIYSSRQFDLAWSLIYKRHIFEMGIIFGPTFTFKLHQSGSEAKPYDYLNLYKWDFRKFGIHGGDISYQYIFSSRKHFEQRIVSFLEISKYKGYNYHRDIPYDPFPSMYSKTQLHLLVGYSFSIILMRKLGLNPVFYRG